MKIACFLLLCVSFASGQEFKISKGNRSKTIRDSDHVELSMGIVNGKKECCSFQVIRGNIVSVGKDSITVNVSSFTLNHSYDTVDEEPSIVAKKAFSIAHSEIIWLRKYKSNKSKKLRDNIMTIGGLFAIAGIVSAGNATLLRDRSSRLGLLFIGTTDLVGGILVSAIAYKPRRYFKGVKKSWKFIYP